MGVHERSITYKVAWLIKKGTQTFGYHLIGQNGDEKDITDTYAAVMISRGLIENMSIQQNGNDIIIRGKGVNLKRLPVYDLNTNQFRDKDGQVLQEMNNAYKNANQNLDQISIIKRILNGRSCIGYICQDNQNRTKQFTRDQVIQLALENHIKNVRVNIVNPYRGLTYEQARQRHNFSEDVWRTVQREGAIKVLVGTNGFTLESLPVLLLDKSGMLIDPEKAPDKITMRAFRVNRGGVLYHNTNNQKKPFTSGDLLVVKGDGSLDIIKSFEIQSQVEVHMDKSQATCDSYLDNVTNYSVEFFGAPQRITINPKQVTQWVIITRKAS